LGEDLNPSFGADSGSMPETQGDRPQLASGLAAFTNAAVAI